MCILYTKLLILQTPYQNTDARQGLVALYSTSTPPSFENMDLVEHPGSPLQDPTISGRCFLLGQHITHSLSPRFHNHVFASLGLPWQFELRDTPKIAEIVPLLKRSDFMGASVTMPHKVAVMDHLDHLTEAAISTQAVNAVFVQEDPITKQRTMVGTNTDCIGIQHAIVAAAPEVVQRAKGRPGMVVGGGGACRAAVYALQVLMGCSEVYLVNRDFEEVKQVLSAFEMTGFNAKCSYIDEPDQALTLEPPVMIVGTIPDLIPRSEDELRARAVASAIFGLSPQAIFLDMCYHPSPETQLISLARQSGLKVVSGIDAFFHQAIASSSLWTGVEATQLPSKKARALIDKHEQFL